tara:strand:- start:361 stop:525 length:165 start_codon:yes stop_codon:yes gene_type:complete
MQCDRCNTTLTDEYTKVNPDMTLIDGGITLTTNNDSYYLCNECANKLIKEEMNK